MFVGQCEAGNEHVVTHILEEVWISVVVDVPPFFGLVVSCSFSVVCFVSCFVGHVLEAEALELCHLVGSLS
jgi:hypothetical protein